MSKKPSLYRRASELRDAVNQPRSSDPYYLSVYLRETLDIMLEMLMLMENEK